LPPRQQPAALLLYLCVIRTGNVLFFLSSYISLFFFFIEGERENELTMKMVVACRSSRSWWPLIVKVFVKKKRVLFFIFIYFLCVCVISTLFSSSFRLHIERTTTTTTSYMYLCWFLNDVMNC
jgi:hypothetical protein